jgi:hypothetical protein
MTGFLPAIMKPVVNFEKLIGDPYKIKQIRDEILSRA